MSSWRTIITEVYHQGGQDIDSPGFRDAADSSAIIELRYALGTELPAALAALYAETNGVSTMMRCGDELIDSGYFIWPIERVIAGNLDIRTLVAYQDIYMPFDNLLFFAEAGNGDYFAYPVINGKIIRPDIFAWNHEDDSREWVAPSLESFIEWWLNGTIKL